ncbi:hypothetical protein RND81_04G048900 [Saponaria officinalis]|uniref:Uncharacterized protein n=1 Tax=Saponaria officinalis TaxID=3572 RepID=A0AAW1LCW1_SAPOF
MLVFVVWLNLQENLVNENSLFYFIFSSRIVLLPSFVETSPRVHLPSRKTVGIIVFRRRGLLGDHGSADYVKRTWQRVKRTRRTYPRKKLYINYEGERDRKSRNCAA